MQLGDNLKSFVKRRICIASGAAWIPFDQLDFIAAAPSVPSCWLPLGWFEAALIMLLSFVGDILINQLSFSLGINRDPWWADQATSSVAQTALGLPVKACGRGVRILTARQASVRFAIHWPD